MRLIFLASLFVIVITSHGIQHKHDLKNENYDCVDIYKQPSLSHPLLKNHKIKLKPSYSKPFWKGRDLSNNAKSSFLSIATCPSGTVPIYRSQINSSYSVVHPLTTQHPGNNYAGITMNSLNYGASATVGIYNPPTKMNQISGAQIWVENGPLNERNSIQVGWTVHPRLYGNNATHLTAYWTADGYKKTGCYDMSCKGFIQVDKKLSWGATYVNTSSYDSQPVQFQPFIYQDGKTGDWWFVVEHNRHIGYWPKELFSHLQNGANYIQYGGWTFNSPDGLSPPMAFGEYPGLNMRQAGFYTEVKVMDKVGGMHDVSHPTEYATSKCFGCNYLGYQGPYLKYSFVYGGPGGQCEF